TLLLFLTHGAMYLALKTDGDIRHRARTLAVRAGLGAAAVAVVFLVWTQASSGTAASAVVFVAAALTLVAGVLAAARGREGWAFTGTFATIGLAVAGLFLTLFPDVMPSSLDAAYSLTTSNASATDYTLTIMTWVAVAFTPIVLMYQGWTYWVFRKRLSVHHIPAPAPEPQDVVA
ncbi:MAG: cytochrome d ubiquinol oxidase subunit II, partial [Actinomycetes bacterium]